MKQLTGLWLLLALASCTSGESESPYGKLLNKAPYQGLTDSIRREPNNDSLYFKRAILLNSNAETEPAIADFRQAWKLRTDERYALGLGTLLLDKQPDSAIQFLRTALQQLPESILLQLSLARALDAANRAEEALTLCRDILARDSSQADIWQFSAGLLERKGDVPGAIRSLEKAWRLAPFDRELGYELAFQYAEAKNPATLVLCDSLDARSREGKAPEPAYYRGLYYANTGNRAEALKAFDAAITRDYYYLNAYIEKGRIYFDQQQWATALAVFEKANTLRPAFPDAWYWMGRCQEALGKKTEARELYQKAAGLDPGFTEAKEAAEKLR